MGTVMVIALIALTLYFALQMFAIKNADMSTGSFRIVAAKLSTNPFRPRPRHANAQLTTGL